MGVSEGVQFLQFREQRKARQDLKKQRDEELSIQGYDRDASGNLQIRPDSSAEAQQLQIEESVALSKSLQGKLSAQETDSVFEDFSHTGNANDLQRAIDNNPNIKQAWANRGVLMVNNIDFENDKDLLERSGFFPTSYDTEEKRNTIKKSAYKLYNGKDWSIGLANKAAAETGVNRRLGSRRSQPLKDNHKEFVDMMSGTKASPNTAKGHKYEDLINNASEKYNVPANLIAVMMRKESSGDPNAVSKKGAGGLMQIMPDTAKDLGLVDVFDPAQNIDAGVKYMSQLLDRYGGDTEKALAAYNAGMGNVDKYGGIPPFPETQEYVSKIKKNLDGGESFSGGSADQVYNTILEHRQGIALASQGKSVKGEAAKAQLEQDKLRQSTRKENISMSQKDRELDIKEETNRIKGREDKTKISDVSRKLQEAGDVRLELYKQFGGEEQFFDANIEQGSKQHRTALQRVVELEQLTGTSPSEKDKEKITSIRRLLSLGDIAKELSAEETGLIDNTLNNAKKYVSDNVNGVNASSAYKTFRNSVRKALSGQALTAAEIQSFNEAFGTLGQQLAPVLEQFKTALVQVQSDLSSTADLMLPISAKVRLGADQKKMKAIQSALQERIDYMQGLVDTPEQTQANEDKIIQSFAPK